MGICVLEEKQTLQCVKPENPFESYRSKEKILLDVLLSLTEVLKLT
jgi:hypothetical protein